MSTHENFITSPGFVSFVSADAENDKILISCEEDFRLYIEQGAGKKVFFSVKNGQPQLDDCDDVAMEAEESTDRSKSERRARKW